MSTKRRRSKPTSRTPAILPRHPVRRPFAGIAISFLSGILGGLLLPLSLPVVLGAGWLLLTLAFAARNFRFGFFAVYGAVACVACALAIASVFPSSPHHLDALIKRPHQHVVIRGMIAGDPTMEKSEDPEKAWESTFTAKAQAINRTGVWEDAVGNITVYWQGSHHIPPPKYGELWEWSGTLRKQTSRGAAWRHLPAFRFYVHDDASAQISEADGLWLKRISYRARQHAHRVLGEGLSAFPDHAGIMRALLLGYRHELPDSLEDLFAWTGTLHIFAISGVHVGVFAGLVIAALRLLGIPRARWALYLAPLLVVYTVGTGMRPSAVRACVMALVFASAYVFNRRPDPPTALAVAACLITGFDPPQLLAPGFIFSFVIVAGLMRLYPVFSRHTQPLLEGELYAPETSTGPRIVVLRYVLGLAAASLAAWLASTPLTAYYFNLFSPVALIGNLFVIPAAFLAVLAGCLSLLAGVFSSAWSEVFNFANVVILSLLIWIIEGLARLPGAYSVVPSPPLMWVLFYYAVFFGGLVVVSRFWRRACAGMALLLVLGGAWWWIHDRSMVVSVLDAGDGHAALIQQRGGVSVLYDAGPRYRSEHTLRALRRAGVQKLDVAVISNPRAGYLGGLPSVLDAMEVGELWIIDHPTRSPVWTEIAALAEEKKIPVIVRAAGDTGAWPGGMSWEALHPPRGASYRRAGDASLVLRVSSGAHAALLSGGASEAVEQAILQRRVSPRAHVWVIGNQGTDGIGSPGWLDEVAPDEVVLAVGPYNRRGWPDRDVLARLESGPWRLWRTDEGGAITVRADSAVRGGKRVDRLHVSRAYAPESETSDQ
jgi:ComEC/Rec2-related protein